jgi:type IV secretory pathway VirD2 relaxase
MPSFIFSLFLVKKNLDQINNNYFKIHSKFSDSRSIVLTNLMGKRTLFLQTQTYLTCYMNKIIIIANMVRSARLDLDLTSKVTIICDIEDITDL